MLKLLWSFGRRSKVGAILAAAVLTLAGCSNSGSSSDTTATGNDGATTTAPALSSSAAAPVTSAAAPVTSAAASAHQISKADLGDAWPLTVDSGVLNCYGSGGVGSATFKSPDGTEYALNGIAKGKYPDIDPLVAASDIPGTKRDIGTLIERALLYCE